MGKSKKRTTSKIKAGNKTKPKGPLQLKAHGEQFIENAEAFLCAHCNPIEDLAYQEALVYFISRGSQCRKEIEMLTELWRRLVDEKMEFERKSGGGLRDIFWWDKFGTDDTHQCQDATILRVVDWADMEGFDTWWEILSQKIIHIIPLGSSPVLEATEWFFNMCRSDFAIRLLERPMLYHFSSLLLGEVDPDTPWLVDFETQDNTDVTCVSVEVAAAIVFGFCRIQSDVVDPNLVGKGTQFLLSSQGVDGSWTRLKESEEKSIEVTAMAIHALALAKPHGWKQAACSGAEWLKKQQKEGGYWCEYSDSDPIWETVLVLDALELAAGGTQVTFKTQDTQPAPSILTNDEMKLRFEFPEGRALFDKRDLPVGTGTNREVLKKLVDNFGIRVPSAEMNENSRESAASDRVRTATSRLNKLFVENGVQAIIKNSWGEGYYIRGKTE